MTENLRPERQRNNNRNNNRNNRSQQPKHLDDDDQIEGDQLNTSSDGTIPDTVSNFLAFFHNAFHRKSYELYKVYDSTFEKLTQRFYNKAPWPSPDLVSALLNEDTVFLMFYKELYYRHIYSKLTVTLTHRVESWINYCELFNYFLGSSAIDLNLPLEWLWDMIDEFIYQFQSFCQYRIKLLKSKSKLQDDIDYVKENPLIWDVATVLQYLHSFQAKSKIVEILEVEKQVGHPLCEDEDELMEKFSVEPIVYYLGYFSTIGLVRINCLLADYYLALKIISPIELTREKSGVSSKVMGCYVSLFYYVGFAYLMQRRYTDAIKTFTTILSQAHRLQHHQRQHEQLGKKLDQIYSLLAIAVSLYPTRIDEIVHTNLREKCSEKMQRMQRAEFSVYEEMFSYSCPKFISPSHPDFDEDLSQGPPQSALQLQLKVFMQEVRQQSLIPMIRSYLRLYTSIPITKLAYFLELDDTNLLASSSTSSSSSSSSSSSASSSTTAVVTSASSSSSSTPTTGSTPTSSSTSAGPGATAAGGVVLGGGGGGLISNEERVLRYLLCYKHKMKTQLWSGSGGPLNAKWSTSSDLDFHIDKDMIHVADTKISRKFGEYFIRQINKLEDVLRPLQPK